jgi:hypothetical protein
MSIFDTDNKYPDDNFWRKNGFIYIGKPGIWIWCGPRLLHWDISDTGTRWGNVNIQVIYAKYKKDFVITLGNTSLFGDHNDEVEFETLVLQNPTQQEIEMALTEKFLSGRLTYKHK